MFITFEGIEGSGKTTQINFLHDFFKEKSIKAVFTKEPGSSKIGGEIRNILLNKNLDLAPYAELFLICLLYTSPSPRDKHRSRMPSSA